MDADPGKLFLGLLFGMVGAGYFMYGRKRGSYMFMGCGMGLGFFPYFVDALWAILLAGALLTALPLVIKGD